MPGGWATGFPVWFWPGADFVVLGALTCPVVAGWASGSTFPGKPVAAIRRFGRNLEDAAATLSRAFRALEQISVMIHNKMRALDAFTPRMALQNQFCTLRQKRALEVYSSAARSPAVDRGLQGGGDFIAMSSRYTSCRRRLRCPCGPSCSDLHVLGLQSFWVGTSRLQILLILAKVKLCQQ